MKRRIAANGVSERVSLTKRVVAFGAACLFAASAAAAPGSGGPPRHATNPIRLAEFVPLPRLNPNHKHVDPIGSLIQSEGDDAGGPVAADDSDGPNADVFLPPVPSTRPDEATTPGAKLADVGLRLAVKMIDNGDPAAATIAAYALPDRVDTKIVNWLIAVSGDEDVTAKRIAEIKAQLGDWPGQRLLSLRYEQALLREDPTPDAVISDFARSKPVSDEAMLLLVRSYLAAGRNGDAAALLRDRWRNDNFSDDIEEAIRKGFAGLLRPADNKARLDRLIYQEWPDHAGKVATLMDKNQKALAAACIKVIKRQSSAGAALAALPAAVKSDPVVLFSRIKFLRRSDKIDQAAALMLKAPHDPKVLVDPDAWWVERRLIARELLDKGDYKTAYRIAAGHSAESNAQTAEAEFHAGWIALEFLHNPAAARKHFLRVEAVSSLPLSLSRAEYWLGRAAAAAGDKAEAAARYRKAGAYPTAFYGQLALAALGARKLPLSLPPPADAALKQSFEARELVQVIRRLTALRHDDRVGIFYRALAEQLSDPREIVLLAKLAEEKGEYQIALQIGKIATGRGLPVDALAFPTAAIPSSAKTGTVGRPMVYAIARQESAFNPGAISRAGARGLLQLMPATARESAHHVGLPFSTARLTTDPGYNATLGAAHLGELFNEFGGSYVMTFASYNAGRSRVYSWVKRYGDPRDPKVDVVNWIEMIPFTETRNYVQRIMENLQVYRARLGDGKLTIASDLKSGTMN